MVAMVQWMGTEWTRRSLCRSVADSHNNSDAVPHPHPNTDLNPNTNTRAGRGCLGGGLDTGRSRIGGRWKRLELDCC